VGAWRRRQSLFSRWWRVHALTVHNFGDRPDTLAGSCCDALAIDLHVDVHNGKWAQHPISIIALVHSQFRQHLHIFVESA